jgi:hypothetical protein
VWMSDPEEHERLRGEIELKRKERDRNRTVRKRRMNVE